MGNAFVLILVGLLIMYAVISDKWFCIEGCAACLAGRTGNAPAGGGGTAKVPMDGIEILPQPMRDAVPRFRW